MRNINTRFNYITLCVLFLNYWDRIYFSYGLTYLLFFELLLISLAHCINKCRIEYAFDRRCRWLRKNLINALDLDIFLPYLDMAVLVIPIFIIKGLCIYWVIPHRDGFNSFVTARFHPMRVSCHYWTFLFFLVFVLEK